MRNNSQALSSHLLSYLFPMNTHMQHLRAALCACAAALALLCAFCASAATPSVIAHRGFWRAPGSAQNSIRSLVKADSIGCWGTEFDVWITADDVLVVNHNAGIGGHSIEASPYDSIAAVRLPNGETLPTLERYLDAAAPLSVQLILELKPHQDPRREDAAIAAIIRMIDEKGLRVRVTYISFSRHAVSELARLSGRPVYMLSATEPAKLAALGATGADYHFSHFERNPRWLDEFKAASMPVNVWTVNDPERMRWCAFQDIDFITTDRPDRAIEIYSE